MKTDLYTKIVLTVIAVCLVWISLGGPSLITPVQAQRHWSGHWWRTDLATVTSQGVIGSLAAAVVAPSWCLMDVPSRAGRLLPDSAAHALIYATGAIRRTWHTPVASQTARQMARDGGHTAWLFAADLSIQLPTLS